MRQTKQETGFQQEMCILFSSHLYYTLIMNTFPLYLLDSGDPDEFREIAALAKTQDSELWGATTNPTLIAKKLAGKKISQQEAYELQKQIVLEIISIVPGAVSAEVYADEKTTAEEMVGQGREIATWHERVVVKLPTTIEGFKARSALRKGKVPINNTLVFSQQQIFAICLHEKIMQEQFGPIQNTWPSFISPFVGRLDDIQIDGMQLVEHGMKIKQLVFKDAPNGASWMLEASVRRNEHMQRGITCKTELITAPAKVYREWFSITNEQKNLSNKNYAQDLEPIQYWQPPPDLLSIQTENAFMQALESGQLNIQHDLTDRGITRFADDWKAIIM